MASAIDATRPTDEEGYAGDLRANLQAAKDEIEALQSGKAAAGHSHDAGDIDSGTLADARVAQSNVKQHEAALSITEAQIADLVHDAVALLGVSLDASVGTPSDGDLLVYRSVDDDWVLEQKPEFSAALDDVTDVTITSPGDNEVLAFDGSSGEWINQTPAEAGLAEAGHTHGLAEITDSGTAASHDVPASGDAAAGEVVKGDDTRLSDARTPSAHTHPLSDVTDSGALAAKDTVATADIDDDAVTPAKLDRAYSEPGHGHDGEALDLQDALLTRPQLKDYSEARTTPSISAGSLTLDLEAGNVFDVVLTEDVTGITVVNAPAAGSLGTVTVRLRQDGTGGRTVDVSGFDFGDQGAPAMPATATTGRLWITALTLDGGTTWEAMAGFEKS